MPPSIVQSTSIREGSAVCKFLFVPFLISAYCLTLTSCLQSLEKENICFETEIRKMLNAMNLQKDQNDQICDEVTRLEKSLMQSQVIYYFTFFLYLKPTVFFVSLFSS